jgi:hypothetical protein
MYQFRHPADGGGTHFRDIGLLQQVYTTLYNPEGCHHYTRRRENLKSHIFIVIDR